MAHPICEWCGKEVLWNKAYFDLEPSTRRFSGISRFVEESGEEHTCKLWSNNEKAIEFLEQFFLRYIYQEDGTPQDPMITLDDFISKIPLFPFKRAKFYDQGGYLISLGSFIVRQLKRKEYGIYGKDKEILEQKTIISRKQRGQERNHPQILRYLKR
jgi:hypothetical protein